MSATEAQQSGWSSSAQCAQGFVLAWQPHDHISSRYQGFARGLTFKSFLEVAMGLGLSTVSPCVSRDDALSLRSGCAAASEHGPP